MHLNPLYAPACFVFPPLFMGLSLLIICGKYFVFSPFLVKIAISSVCCIGLYLAYPIPEGIFLFQSILYLNPFRLLQISLLVKGSLPNKAIAPFGLMILLYCSHNG